MRVWLVGLIGLATIGFVIGTSIERGNATHESVAQLRAEGAGTQGAKTGAERAATHPGEGAAAGSKSTPDATTGGGESATKHAAEGGASESTPNPAPPSVSGESAASHAAEGSKATKTETHTELRPLGVNIESVPFIVLAAVASLALAALGWVRPRWLLGLAAIAVVMVLFGALDVREMVHQSDENRTGLVILAGVVAALHFAAGGIATAMAVRRSPASAPGAARPIPS